MHINITILIQIFNKFINKIKQNKKINNFLIFYTIYRTINKQSSILMKKKLIKGFNPIDA